MNARTKRPRLAAISAASGVALLLGGIAPLLAAAPAFATSFIPYQFISKLYTEGLGRSADQGGWTNYANVFASGGCSVSTLDTVANSILLSPEFNGLGYSNPALVEVAYRALLNREPDPTGYATWNGDSMSTIVSGIEASSEFSSLASTICSTPDYHYGSNPPLALSPTGPGYSGSEAGLQSLLNAATSGSTVTLQERALVPLTTTLVIPAGVTLTTYGSPSTNTYAEMGRLARQPGWSGNSVDIDGGAHVTHTWIDGDRLRESSYDRLRFNLEILPRSGTSLTYDRIGNTSGGDQHASRRRDLDRLVLGYRDRLQPDRLVFGEPRWRLGVGRNQ